MGKVKQYLDGNEFMGNLIRQALLPREATATLMVTDSFGYHVKLFVTGANMQELEATGKYLVDGALVSELQTEWIVERYHSQISELLTERSFRAKLALAELES